MFNTFVTVLITVSLLTLLNNKQLFIVYSC